MFGKFINKTVSAVETISVEGIRAGKDKAQIDADILAHLSRVDLSSNAIAKQNSLDSSFFVKGWRPALGWVCAIGFIHQTVFEPYAIKWFGVPPMDTSLLLPTITAMLGTYGIRAWEKSKEGILKNKGGKV